jgi:hypothetical protein
MATTTTWRTRWRTSRVGDYKKGRLANVGINHWALDAGGGYTYFNKTNGREFSAVLGFTYNFENPDTHYQNGVDAHLDWGASQFLSEHWHVGLVGYAYQQITGDSGAGARLGDFNSSPGCSASGPWSATSSSCGTERGTSTSGVTTSSRPRTGRRAGTCG